jgi:hypothetical protein
MAMSHPHLVGSMVAWSRALGDPPIYLHADLKPWIQRSDPVIKFWEGEMLVWRKASRCTAAAGILMAQPCSCGRTGRMAGGCCWLAIPCM